MTKIESVPSIEKGNLASHAIGLGQMNLHGYLAREGIYYGSEEALDFTNIYFYTVTYYALLASNQLAIEKNNTLKVLRIQNTQQVNTLISMYHNNGCLKHKKSTSYLANRIFIFLHKKIGKHSSCLL